MPWAEQQLLSLYSLETYLFDTVGPGFRKSGGLSSFDFFCIMIWKANRARKYAARRLLCHGAGFPNLDAAVAQLADDIWVTKSDQDRMAVLWKTWGFALPTASAVLTVLYPETFSVYDVRACDVLNAHRDLRKARSFPAMWSGYLRFLEDVAAYGSPPLSLRDRDRLLWATSFQRELEKNINSRFGVPGC